MTISFLPISPNVLFFRFYGLCRGIVGDRCQHLWIALVSLVTDFSENQEGKQRIPTFTILAQPSLRVYPSEEKLCVCDKIVHGEKY